jgi:hypothetical protein
VPNWATSLTPVHIASSAVARQRNNGAPTKVAAPTVLGSTKDERRKTKKTRTFYVLDR